MKGLCCSSLCGIKALLSSPAKILQGFGTWRPCRQQLEACHHFPDPSDRPRRHSTKVKQMVAKNKNVVFFFPGD